MDAADLRMDVISTPAAEPALRVAERSARMQAAIDAPDVPWYLDPREILLSLRLRRIWAVVPVVVGLALAGVVLALTPPRYTATAEILIDPRGLQIVKDDLSPPGQASDASLLLVDSQMQVLASDDVLRKVVDRFALDRDPEFDGTPGVLGRALARVVHAWGAAAAPDDAKLAALRTLRDRLNVKRQERTFALVASVTTSRRDRSAQLAQGVAETYLAADVQTRTDLASSASDAVKARLGELQAEVAAAEDKAQAFRTAQNLVGTRTQLVSEQQLGQIGDQLGAARARAAERAGRLAQIVAAQKSGTSLDTLPEVLQSATITQLRTQLATAERNVADLSTTLSARHPAMMAAENDVRSARAQLAAEVARIASSVRTDARAAAASVADLSATLDRGKKEAVAVGDAMVKLRELERQIEARRSVYETFLVRARELQAQQQLGTSASRIISPATPPARRDGPPTLLFLGAVLVLSLGLGVAAALLAEAWSGRPRTLARLARRLDAEVLGAVPPAPAGRPGVAAADEARYDLAVLRLRNRLWRIAPRGGPRVVLVTAADHVSGKGRLALKLATLAAADHERILLVDADPAGTLPGVFDLPIVPLGARPGAGASVLPERGVAQLPSLRYLDASSLASTFDSRTIVEEILARAEQMDAIIVNAGTLGSDRLLETFVGDRHAQTVLLAVSAGRSRLATAERAMTSLAARASRAAVLTDATADA